MKPPRHVGQDNDDWAMPFGDSIYTHAPEPQSLTVGTSYQSPTDLRALGPRAKRKPRRIGFRKPGKKR